MKISKKGSIIVVILISAAAIIGLMINQVHTRTALSRQAVMFDLVPASRMDLSDKIDATGNVVTDKNSAIYPPYNATVKEILVKPGDSVRKGQTLLTLQLKDADLINYSSTWKSSLVQAQENLSIAQNALERQKILFKVQGTTIDEVENAETKVRQYRAQVEEYQLKLQSLVKNGVDRNNDILIQAPFDAVVSWIDVKLAEPVTTTDQLLTLGGDRAIQVEAEVDQGDIDQVRVGLPATITANDVDRTVIPGMVTSFGSTGTTNANVVTFPVVIKPMTAENPGLPGDRKKLGGFPKPPGPGLPKPPKLANRSRHGLLKSGMTVDVTIMVNAHPNVLAVPLKAVTKMNGNRFVKVFRQGRYITKKVRVGYANTDYVEIISGLTEGDQVAVARVGDNAQNGSSGNMSKRGGMMGGPMGPPPMGR
ncbi:MAG TPA: HlyD family efflux transporter periplasmic adaptor subunit [Bacillota bacterium]|nr:HlyD family efflux transporter periplasmic adaptor subunit [Bacillota bacterium]